MKKSLVVLLIVVLAVGSAFAAISGKFTGTYTYDIDDATLGWDPAQAPKFAFTLLADTKSTENTGDVYAEMAATLNYGIKEATAAGSLTTSVKFWDAKLTKVAINGADWSLDLIANTSAKDYAKSAIDFEKDADKKDVAYDFSPADLTKIDAIKFTKNGYSVAAMANYNPTDAEKIAIVAETKEFASDDIKAQVAAAFSTVKSAKTFVGNLKASYGEMATVAADFAYAAEKFNFDAALNFKYAPVTVDAYYATYAVAKTYGTKTNLLSAKLVADLAEYAPAKLTVTAKDVLNAKTFDVEVETTAIADTVLTVYGKTLLTNNKLGAKAVYTGVEKTELTLDASYTLASKIIAASLDAEYTADLYTVAAGVAFEYADAASLSFNASVESEKLVSGATLSLAYESGDNLLAEKNIGSVTASCEIAF